MSPAVPPPPRAPRASVLLLGLALALSGCVEDIRLNSGCRTNDECDPGFVCEERRCRCTSDASCGPYDFCNPAGSCQKRIDCKDNRSCPAGLICDQSGACIEMEKCTTDVQCRLGEICDQVRFRCVPGCRDVGDCALGDICECAAGAQTCPVGLCRRGPCFDDSYCRYGQKCVEDAPGEPKRCVRDERGPYCVPCEIGSPGKEYCPGDSGNYCLIDTSKQYGSFFCGVVCKETSDCPWGFRCNDVRILTESTCTATRGCPLRPRECASDADCPGGECDVKEGRCRGICLAREGAVQGGCTCIEDSDCPNEFCEEATGECSFSRKKCDPFNPRSCNPINCVHVTDPLTERTYGYCRIGRNCAPFEGVTCDMVREQQQR